MTATEAMQDFGCFVGESFMYAAPFAAVVVIGVWVVCRLFPGTGTTHGGGPG